MPQFHVIWEIDCTEDSPEAAARFAWDVMRRTDSMSNVFDVVDIDGSMVRIDLQEVDGAKDK